MRELIAAWSAVAGHAAHLRHVAIGVALDFHGQEALGWAGGAVELQHLDYGIAHALSLLYGVDGQDDFAGSKVECSLNHLCRHWEAFHNAWLKRTDFAGK